MDLEWQGLNSMQQPLSPIRETQVWVRPWYYGHGCHGYGCSFKNLDMRPHCSVMGFRWVTSLIYSSDFFPIIKLIFSHFLSIFFPLSDIQHRTYVTMTHISCFINNHHKLNNNNYTENHNKQQTMNTQQQQQQQI